MNNLNEQQDYILDLILKDIATNHNVQTETFYHYDIKEYAYLTEYEKQSLDEGYWCDECGYGDEIKKKYEISHSSGADPNLYLALKSILHTISFPNVDILPRLTTAYVSNTSELVLKSHKTKRLEHEKDDSLTYEIEYEIYIRIVKRVDFDENRFLRAIEMYNNLRIYNKELGVSEC